MIDIGSLRMYILIFGILLTLFLILIPHSDRIVAQGKFDRVIYVAGTEIGLRWTIIYFTDSRGFVAAGGYYKAPYPRGTLVRVVRLGRDRYKVNTVNNADG